MPERASCLVSHFEAKVILFLPLHGLLDQSCKSHLDVLLLFSP